MDTILLIEEDNETRPVLKQNLQRKGYHVVVALDQEDAIERVSGGRLQPDLILLDIVGATTDDEALRSARLVRRCAELDNRTPIVLMPEKYGANLEGKDINVDGNDWITYPEDSEQLHGLIARLLPSS